MGPCKQRELFGWHDNKGFRRSIRVFAVACLFAAAALAARAEPHGTPLQLEVSVNGAPLHSIGAFVQLPSSSIGAAPSELKELGIEVPASLAKRDLVLLNDIPGTSYDYRPRTQSIDIHIDPAWRIPKILDARAGQDLSTGGQATPGVVLNYDLFASAANHRDDNIVALDGLAAMLDGRFFGSFGTLAISGIAHDYSRVGDPFLRLDTTWSRSDPESLVTYRLGDFISGGLPWTRPIRMGGVQAQRNFGLRPDLITMPLPSFSGSAAVPSTVDVYVNNTKAYSGEVPAGPSQINNIPTVSGAGFARVVVRDASGRETTMNAPFYASASLLRPGTSDFSVEGGFARRNYGSISDDYWDSPVASLSWRYGLTDQLTLESHAEGASDLINAGLGASTQVGAWGRLSGAASLSAAKEGIGVQAYGALEFQAFGFDGRISCQHAIADYADLASVTSFVEPGSVNSANFIPQLHGAAPPRDIDQLSLGVPLAFDATRLALNLMHLEWKDGPSSDIISASYSRLLADQVTVLATAFHDFGSEGGTGLFIGLMMPLDAKTSVTTSVTHDRYGIGYGAEAARPLGSEPGSLGWQVRVTGGESQHDVAAIAYRGQAATVQGRLLRNDASVAGTTEITGSVVAANGGVFLANRIDDAFAVVDVGAANVDVLHENRRVATTDQNGKALITGLHSYQNTTIAIDPAKLPVDADVPRTEIKIAPPDRAGVAVNFGIRRDAASALVVFRTPNGTFIPVGTHGQIEGREGEFVIGYDGQAFLKDIAATTTAIISLTDGQCRATFSYVKGPDQTVIDPAVCR
jgi:outer membrane usher protein